MEGEAWPDALYVEADDGEEGKMEPSGGLWLRHMDPETGLAYHMNDETGASCVFYSFVRGKIRERGKYFDPSNVLGIGVRCSQAAENLKLRGSVYQLSRTAPVARLRTIPIQRSIIYEEYVSPLTHAYASDGHDTRRVCFC